MALMTLMNIFAGTLLMTSLYAFSRPILDRVGDPALSHIRPIVLRTQRSRARERQNAMLLAASGIILLILVNASQLGATLPSTVVFGVPCLLALVVYKYRRRRI